MDTQNRVPKRDVLTLIKLKLIDVRSCYSNREDESFHYKELTIWKPDEGILSGLKEGRRFKVVH